MVQFRLNSSTLSILETISESVGQFRWGKFKPVVLQ